MKTTFKCFLSLMLSVLLLCGALPLMLTVSAKDGYKVGDVIEFGSYPQTEVKDEALIAALNEQPQTWISYGYYVGNYAETGEYANGQMKAEDFMQYCDVTVDGLQYRGVRFTKYRPFLTDVSSSGSEPDLTTYQAKNGYYTGVTYWFRYEPLQWRMLDPATGLVLCEIIIDSQPINNYILLSGKDEYELSAYWGDAGKTHYANNYAHSSLRQWMNNDFYKAAFTSEQQNAITATTLDNSAYSVSYSKYDSMPTTDKVFLLSRNDALNTAYGFSSSDSEDPDRQAGGSDYAKCQGLFVTTYNGCSYWWLRSSGRFSSNTCIVRVDGQLSDQTANDTNEGVRPAMQLDLKKIQLGQTVTVKTQVTSDAASTVTGAGTYNIGDTVTLIAHPNGKERLDGWYVDDVRVSIGTTFTFTAQNDVTVRAVFTSKPVSGGIVIKDMTLQAKSSALLKPVVNPDGANYTLTYVSSDPKVASVDQNGNVIAKKAGKTTITVTATDAFGNIVQDTCTVTVNYAVWQWLILIFLFGFIWY